MSEIIVGVDESEGAAAALRWAVREGAIRGRTSGTNTPVVGLVVSSVLVTGLMLMNYTESLVDQFTFVILLATLTTLVPYAYSAGAQLLFLATDRARFADRRLAVDAVVAGLAFGYSLWMIAGSGYEVVFKGFMLLTAGIPVYVWMRWQTTRAEMLALPDDGDDTLEVGGTDLAKVIDLTSTDGG